MLPIHLVLLSSSNAGGAPEWHAKLNSVVMMGFCMYNILLLRSMHYAKTRIYLGWYVCVRLCPCLYLLHLAPRAPKHPIVRKLTLPRALTCMIHNGFFLWRVLYPHSPAPLSWVTFIAGCLSLAGLAAVHAIGGGLVPPHESVEVLVGRESV